MQAALDKERELNKAMIVKIQTETDDKLQEIWN